MDNALGSYAYGEFSNNENELKRLMRQAEVAWTIEKDVLAKHGINDKMTVADLACGPGIVSGFIQRDLTPNGHVIGVELNDSLLEVAESIHADTAHSPTFRKGDVYELDCLEDDSIDFAYSRFLFQHLNRSDKAIEVISKKLRTGGRIAILDTDDALFHFAPAIDGMDRFIALANDQQQNMGGDRLIGRKLAGMLWAAGFTDIKTQVVTINTDIIGGLDFLAMTTSFKLELMPEEEQAWAAGLIETARTHVEKGNFFGQTAVYFVSAQEP